MNIEPGTRVRFTDQTLPALVGEDGTYLRREGIYYKIRWDGDPSGWTHLAMEDEFEVIDE